MEQDFEYGTHECLRGWEEKGVGKRGWACLGWEHGCGSASTPYDGLGWDAGIKNEYQERQDKKLKNSYMEISCSWAGYLSMPIVKYVQMVAATRDPKRMLQGANRVHVLEMHTINAIGSDKLSTIEAGHLCTITGNVMSLNREAKKTTM